METDALPVLMKTKIFKRNGMRVYYPVVYGLPSATVQQQINQTIVDTVDMLMSEQYEQQGFDHFDEVIGLYEVKTNERKILSLSFTNYAIAKQAAHGLTIMASQTFNVETGQIYSLADLFIEDSNYIEVLSRHVQAQIDKREIPLLEPFTGIRSDQDFYLADKSIVLYFQPYEITAGYYGFPMFPISVYALETIINPDGPLNSLATNS